MPNMVYHYKCLVKKIDNLSLWFSFRYRYRKLPFSVNFTILWKKKNISSPLINGFNLKRSHYIQELMDTCKISWKVAKEFILTIMYLGQMGDYCSNNGFENIPPQWVDDLQNEFKNVSNLIVALNNDIFKTVSSSKKKNILTNKHLLFLMFYI